MKSWKTARRVVTIDRPLVMGILNVTPDSFSDGGNFLSVDDAVRRCEQMIQEGADIIDIGGESTRPGSKRIEASDEIKRVVPVISAIRKRFETPISIDTSKSEVAAAALDEGAEIINDISGLRWDERIADLAGRTGAGLVLMHSRGEFETLHSLPPVGDIVSEVQRDFRRALCVAEKHDVSSRQISLDIGIGFGKTPAQNLELIAKLGKLALEFAEYPLLVGTSRKSFIGKLLGVDDPAERLSGSLASAAIAVFNGASIVRVHDVRETVNAVNVVSAALEEMK